MVETNEQVAKQEAEENACASKRVKVESKYVLEEFEFVKILNEDTQRKTIFVQAIKKKSNEDGEGKKEDAVIIFEKPHFGLDEVKSFLNIENDFDLDIKNDIYSKLCVYPKKPFNNVQVQLIYPASEKHIAKYSMQEAFFVQETADDWLNITSQYANKSALDIQWVFNILEHKSEVERIICEDPDPTNGFILVPDMKWDSRVVENLYVLAICHRKNIRCIRDLQSSHLELLENIRDKCLKAIEEKFGVAKSKVRAFVHYQPTFYHLHVHFSHIKFQPPGIPERNYPLNNVIENLKVDSDYYKKATLEFVVKENEKLFELYKHKFN